jgi:hypothetical protein
MLRERQRQFAAAVFDGDARVAAQVLPGRLTAEQAVQIYRHNVLGTLTTALGAVYPVVEKLVDSGFFGYAAHEYLRDHHPMSGNLHDFGGAFADFLATFAPAAALPYLPDVARLEWAWHRAFHAAGTDAFDPARLASVDPERLPLLRFVLHPSAQLVASKYPIVRIFEVNQDGYEGSMRVDLDAGGVTALVIRRDLTVYVEPLAAGTAALLAAFHQNRSLAEALQAALAVQPDFDLNAVLADHVRRGTIVQAHAG